MKKPPSVLELTQTPPFQLNQNSPIWLACRFTLRRNLDSFPFSQKMNPTDQAQMTTLLKKTLENLPKLKQAVSWDAKALSPSQKEAIDEHFLMESGHHQAYHTLIEPSLSFVAKLGEEDHLTLSCLESEKNWHQSFETLLLLETEIGKILRYAFHSTFGYLTADPALCGTGLKGEAILHLPCLTYLEKCSDLFDKTLGEDILYHGLGGAKELIGDFLVIENRFSLGTSEDHLLDSLHKAASELIRLEKEHRAKLKDNPDSAIKDKICRAYGLLSHCYQIETKEAFAALSLLKLGIDLNWVSGITDEEITKLFFTCRRAHLLLQEASDLTPDQLAVKRAEVLKSACQKMTLTSKPSS